MQRNNRKRDTRQRRSSGQNLTGQRGPSIPSEETILFVLLRVLDLSSRRLLRLRGGRLIQSRARPSVRLISFESRESPSVPLELSRVASIKMSLLTRRVSTLRSRGRIALEADRLAQPKSGQSTERGLDRPLAFARHRVLALARALLLALSSFLRDNEEASLASRPVSIEQDRDARVLLI
jgi:hypothetical protein